MSGSRPAAGVREPRPAAPAGAAAGDLVCGLCGLGFGEDRGQPACRACPLSRHACRYVRCPRCGYENPARPGWLLRAEGWFRRLPSPGRSP